jgi:hypothetical protein
LVKDMNLREYPEGIVQWAVYAQSRLPAAIKRTGAKPNTAKRKDSALDQEAPQQHDANDEQNSPWQVTAAAAAATLRVLLHADRRQPLLSSVQHAAAAKPGGLWPLCFTLAGGTGQPVWPLSEPAAAVSYCGRAAFV